MTKQLEALIARKGSAVTGNYYLAECGNCGEMFTSERMTGGWPIADTGDYGDCYCPHCGAADCDISDYGDIKSDAAMAWNHQQKHIDALIAALEQAQQQNNLMNDAMHAAIALTSAGKDLNNWDSCVRRLHEWGGLPDYCIALYVDFIHGKVSESKLLDFGFINDNGAVSASLAEKRIAELEASPLAVKLPESFLGIVQSGKVAMVKAVDGHWLNKTAVIEAIRAAGGQAEGE